MLSKNLSHISLIATLTFALADCILRQPATNFSRFKVAKSSFAVCLTVFISSLVSSGAGFIKITYEFDTDSENFDLMKLRAFQQSEEIAYALSEVIKQARKWDKSDPWAEIPAGEVYDTITDIVARYVDMEKIGY